MAKAASTSSADELYFDDVQQRLQRLEDAVASLLDTRALEDRVTDRVRDQLKNGPSGGNSTQTTAPHTGILERAKSSLPKMASVFTEQQKETAIQKGVAASIGVAPEKVKEAWFFLEVGREFKAIFRMFFDIRYHVAWWVRTFVVVLLVAIFLTPWFLWMIYLYEIPLIGIILDKIIVLLMGFILYKVLHREARRYLQWKKETQP